MFWCPQQRGRPAQYNCRSEGKEATSARNGHHHALRWCHALESSQVCQHLWCCCRVPLPCPKTFLIEIFQVVNYKGQTPCTWTWWDPQQFVEASPWGHTENPNRDHNQDMDLSELSSWMESSNGDPNPQIRIILTPPSFRPILLTSCLCKVLECMINTHLVSWEIKDTR